MQPSALAHTISLHRVWFPASESSGNGLGDKLASSAELEPIIVIKEDGDAGKCERQGIIEQCTLLRSVLGRFCWPLLVKLGNLAAQRHATGRNDLHWVGATSPVAEEGIFVQVPSCHFTSECMRAATSGTAMDVIYYNSLGRRWWRDGENKADSCESIDLESADIFDEGYIYGFAQFVDVGYATEGLMLSAFSTSPLFNMLRTVVLETVPHLFCAARDFYFNRRTVSRVEEKRTVSAVYAEVMSPLREIVDARSTACSTPANRHFYLSFSHTRVSIVRPDDLRYPFVNAPLPTLFLSFSYDALRVIHSLLLQERRVVFIGATPQHASACVVSVQAMLSPFIWTLPIVPYMPPEACEILEALGDSGFILGSTAEMVPHLMLHSGLSNPQRCSSSNEKVAENERGRIWFADGRTGVVGVSPLDADVVPFTMLDLVPPSEKVKEAMKRIVSKEARQLFSVALSSTAAQELGIGPLWSSTLKQCVALADLEEMHGAFLEYSVTRLVGNYRKGLIPASNGIGDAGGSPAHRLRLQGGVAFIIDYTRFLPYNLENNATLARRIAGTRMFCHWEDTVASLETVGVLRSLVGEFVRSRLRSRQRGSVNSPPRERETPATHYYLSHPRMLGMLRIFYTRSMRRFPELYNDLQGSDLARLSEGASVFFTMGNSPTTIKGSSVSCNNGNSSSGSGGKNSMRSFFSKATKAVKNSLASRYNRIPVQVFVQAYGSFANKTNYEKDPNKPASLSKAFKSNATAAAAALAPTQQLSCPTIPLSPTATTATDVDDDLCGTCSNLFGAYVEDSDALRSLSTRDDQSTPVVCRRLPLDVIHQFGRYHTLLDSRTDSMYTTGGRGGTASGPSVDELKRFLEFGQLFAADSGVWSVLESKRLTLLSMPEEISSLSPEPQQQQQQQPSLLFACNNETNCGGVVFQAQPLPFSMDLVTRAVELPPVPDTLSFNKQSGNATAAMGGSSDLGSYQGSAGAAGNVMDDFFSFATTHSHSSSESANAFKQLEEFFQ
ncbi:hypothetical protein BCY84_20020 [Trypanosoma cruzi cruzi]|nr:hypothetical protein BCY84_20020 [Trypanosoma cruzi cruzi]